MLKLYIGNKNYSSWSLRPWLLLTHFGIPFEEVLVRFDNMADNSPFKQHILSINPTGTVPILVDGDLVIWDSLAICEYVAEYVAADVAENAAKGARPTLWPRHSAARARARSICAEIHSGLSGIRQNFGMNLEAKLPHIGQIVLRDNPTARAHLARIDAMWSDLLAQHGGPMLFGEFSVADAFYAPVCTRIQTYDLPISPAALAYAQRVRQLPAMQAWTQAALLERDFVVFDEPYRAAR